ncbi:hypothetical protein RRG08_004175 [Elysia crispata]|uniref:Uncharacterized protein n=1 Tax=Elysia crispata TaxID=231223 RepID=A0AAE1D5R2_9GAST|nr:hypothetical protein RRG08_004175 [Elysia crispata]
MLLQHMVQAYGDIRSGRSQRDTGWDFDLTCSVLQRFFKKRDVGEESRNPEGQTILYLETEKSIVCHLAHLSDWGFPFYVLDLRRAVKRILDKERWYISFFKDNCPRKEWA